MMRHTFCGLLGLIAIQTPTLASAEAIGDWNVSFAQGHQEHIVSNGPGNSFNISCNVSANPDSIGKPGMFVEIVGKNPERHSYVDIFAIDDVYRLPVGHNGSIDLDCRVCITTFTALWNKLRKANAIVVQYKNGQNSTFKTRGAAKALSSKPCQG